MIHLTLIKKVIILSLFALFVVQCQRDQVEGIETKGVKGKENFITTTYKDTLYLNALIARV